MVKITLKQPFYGKKGCFFMRFYKKVLELTKKLAKVLDKNEKRE